MNADQRHGTVDAEPDFAERRVDDRAADGGRVAAEDFSQRLGNGSGFPIDQNADQHQHHVDHVGRGAASLEEFGRDPSADDRSGDARVVVQREGQVALRGIHDIHLLQVDRRPVADAVTHQIDESVGQGDEPENLVLENVVDEEFFEGDFLFFSLGGLYRRVIVAVFVDGRQPAGLGRVAQRPPAENGQKKRHATREDEGCTPRVAPSQHGEDGDSGGYEQSQRATADRVRRIPYRHFETAFVLGEPVGHDTPAGRPSHARKPAHQQHQTEDNAYVDAGICVAVRDQSRANHQQR